MHSFCSLIVSSIRKLTRLKSFLSFTLDCAVAALSSARRYPSWALSMARLCAYAGIFLWQTRLFRPFGTIMSRFDVYCGKVHDRNCLKNHSMLVTVSLFLRSRGHASVCSMARRPGFGVVFLPRPEDWSRCRRHRQRFQRRWNTRNGDFAFPKAWDGFLDSRLRRPLYS